MTEYFIQEATLINILTQIKRITGITYELSIAEAIELLSQKQ